MKLNPFYALFEEKVTAQSRTTGRDYSRIILKIPAYVDSFSGEKKGNDEFYEAFISETRVENMPILAKGDKVEVSGYLNGKAILNANGDVAYPTSMSITEIKKV